MSLFGRGGGRSALDSSHGCWRFLTRVLSPLEGDEAAILALRDDIGRGAIIWESLVELASRHLVTPTLYRAFVNKSLLADLPDEVRHYFSAIHSLNSERNRRIVDQTREIAAALNDAGMEPVALKGVAHLLAGLYADSGVRVIGDIDLLVPSDRLEAAVGALARLGYRQADLDFCFAGHHHHPPLVRRGDAASVELHTEPVPQRFADILSAERVMRDACQAMVDGCVMRLPSLRDQIVHHIVHAQLAHRDYWSGRVSLRYLSDLAGLMTSDPGAIDWGEIQSTFARAGHGSACGAYLIVVERLLGLPLPAQVRSTPAARFACQRVVAQARHPWLMGLGAWYGYHRAMIAELWSGPRGRRRVLARLVHPRGYRRYLNALGVRIG